LAAKIARPAGRRARHPGARPRGPPRLDIFRAVISLRGGQVARAGTGMKILDVRTHVLSTPIEEPFAFSMDGSGRRGTRVFELVTDAGITDWGESRSATLRLMPIAATKKEVIRMQVIDLDHQPKEEWRPGVITRMHVSAGNGASQLCVFEQWCEPGHGAPTHLHAVEEILHVFAGQAEVWIGEARTTLTPGQLVVVPAGRKHGFSNTGKTLLHIQSMLAEPVFEAAYDDKRETPRRYLPG
jgi:quercetin dioxygenase-like cupin family protein